MRSIKEDFDLSSPIGEMVITIMAGLSQLERSMIQLRVKEGVAAARARGRVGGRPRTDQKKLDSALKLYDAQTHSISEICSLTSVSSSVLYRAIRARKKDQQ